MSNGTFVEKLPMSHVETGLAGDMAQFLFKTWRENHGRITGASRMTELSPWLLLTLPEAAGRDVPRVTFAGRQAPLFQLFPQALGPGADKDPALFLPDLYRQGIADGYQQVFAGEPHLDIQRTGDRLGAGMPDMTLQRLLVKFETATGFARVFCLVKLLATHGDAGGLGRVPVEEDVPHFPDWGPVGHSRRH